MSTIQHLGVSEHLRGGKCVLPPLSDTINSITGPRSLHEAFKQSSSPKGALTTVSVQLLRLDLFSIGLYHACSATVVCVYNEPLTCGDLFSATKASTTRNKPSC